MAVFNPSLCCKICGSVSIQVDEVVGPDRLILSECRRCRHRWTDVPRTPDLLRTTRTSRLDSAEVALAS